MKKSSLLPVAAALLACALAPTASLAADAPDTSTWAKFSTFTYEGKSDITPPPGEYVNPIIAGFHPDPSICRVGEDYYLVNSAFNYFPSIPIFHSKDLVNWTQIGNVLDRPSQFTTRGGQMQDGTYAPTIRYHDGTFYVVNTILGPGSLGNFYVTAKDPQGPWSEPIKLNGVGGIDPDFFFDNDGKAYVTSCADPPRSFYNGHRAMTLQEMDFAQKKPVGEKTILVNGGVDLTTEALVDFNTARPQDRPNWCEGPHVYKIKGKYYCMCAQGGTGTAHTEVIFRSDNLRGPYVPWNKNPILGQLDLPAGRPNVITSTGHADLVETQNGEWFAVFLGCQPYQGNFFNTGRETFLLPVTWTQDGWPMIFPPRTPMPQTVKKPNLPADKPPAIATTGTIRFTDNFDSDTLAFNWVGVRALSSQWYVSSKAAQALFLEPRAVQLSGGGNPSFLVTRQQNNDFTATVTLTAQSKTADCTAGLALFQNDSHYYALSVKIAAGKLTEISVQQPPPGAGRGFGRGRGRGGIAGTQAGSQPATQAASLPSPPAGQPLPENLTAIGLKIEGAGPVTRCYYAVGNGAFIQVGQDLPSSFLSTETAGGFQGAMVGVFAHN